jgi:hypothetical protein
VTGQVASAEAVRFIAQALDEGGANRRQVEWQSWTNDQSKPLPSYLAQVALHALPGMALRFDDRIADESTHAAEAAQMENDLGYVVAVEEALLEYLQQPAPAYG